MEDKRIAIIVSTENDIKPFLQYIDKLKETEIAMLTFYYGYYNNKKVVAVCCGGGKVNAAITTQILINKFKVNIIIIAGVAGAVDRRLTIGDTIISTETAYYDVIDEIVTEHHPWMDSIYFKSDNDLLRVCMDLTENNNFKQQVYFGRIVTGEKYILEQDRLEILDRFQALAVDMEITAIAQTAYVNKIPFIGIKSISDKGEIGEIAEFESNYKLAVTNSIYLLKKLVRVL